MHTNIGLAIKPNFMSSFLYFFKYAFSAITLKLINLHNKTPNMFAFNMFGLKYCFHPNKPC